MEGGECEESMKEEMMLHCFVQDDGLADLKGGGVRNWIDGINSFGEPVDYQIYILEIEGRIIQS